VAKIKPVRKKRKGTSPATQSGISCLILLVAGMALVMFFIYFVMKYAK